VESDIRVPEEAGSRVDFADIFGKSAAQTPARSR
jgi:hypothetical protein